MLNMSLIYEMNECINKFDMKNISIDYISVYEKR